MFSYDLFIHNTIPTLAIFSMVMAMLSLWIYRSPFVWGAFSLLALFLGHEGKLIEPIALLPLFLLLLCHLILSTSLSGLWRMITILVASLISFCLIFHIMPGFLNFAVLKKVTLSKGAAPYSFYLNFDKPFVGLFTLAFSLHLIDSWEDFLRVMKRSMLFIIPGIAILLGAAYYLHLVRFDMKLPLFTPVWIVANLFLTTIPEEAFFRGFLQREVKEALPSRFGALLSIILVSLSFAAIHLPFTDNYPYLTLT